MCPNCEEEIVREVTSDLLISIPTSSLLENSGSCTNSINDSLGDYVSRCSVHDNEVQVKKTITTISNYYCCVLEYAEDSSNGFIQAEKLPNIIIDDLIEVNNFHFELAGIIYFKSLHYTCHVRGVQHPKFLPIKSARWFYHDGMKESINLGKFAKGLLFENDPNLNVDIVNDPLKPYVLIYRIILENNRKSY